MVEHARGNRGHGGKIALETSKGDLPLAVGLGFVLIGIMVVINALAWAARRYSERFAG